MIPNRVTVFPAMRETVLKFFAPVARPMRTVVPMASPTTMTVKKCIAWLPMATAVIASAPSNCPTIRRSASP